MTQKQLKFICRLPPVGRRSGKRTGFALVIALSLMSFVLLLLLTISTFVQVETATSNQQLYKNEARANALLAAHIALGTLQKNLGDDQRITAQAGIFDSDPTTETINGVNEPYWVGVWTTAPEDLGGTGIDSVNQPALIKRGVNDGTSPQGNIDWLVSAPNANPLSHSRGTNDIPLLWVDRTDVTDTRNIIVPTSDISGNNAEATGRYAWWVSDEGQKASVSIENNAARSTNDLDQIVSVLNAPRMAAEFISDTDEALDLSVLKNLSSNDIPLDNLLSRLSQIQTLEIPLGDINADESLLKNRYHDLTTVAYGVMSDVRSGGLKQDLTAAFSSDQQFQDLLDSHGEGGQLIFGQRSNGFSPVGSNYSNISSHHSDPGGPPWAQLRSFFQTTLGTQANARSIAPRKQENEQMGIHPIVTHFSLHFHLLILRDQITGEYVPRLMIFPAVILWNPYNVKLEATDYTAYFQRDTNRVAFKWRAELNYEDSAGAQTEWNTTDYFLGDEHQRPMPFNMSSSFEPGEAKLFIPGATQEWKQPWGTGDLTDGNQLVDAKTVDWGGYLYHDHPNRFVPAGGLIPGSDIEVVLYSEYKPDVNRRIGPKITAGHFVSLYFTNDLPAENNWNATPPIYIINGTSLYLTYDNGDRLGYTVGVNDIETVQDWNSRKAPEDHNELPQVTGSSYPAMGTYMHFRWLKNAHAPSYNANNWDPQFSFLAHFNPRASRSWRTPTEVNSKSINANDSIHHPLYYSGAESHQQINISTESAWTFIQALAPFEVPVGYTDDSNISTIDRSTLFDLPTGPEYFQSIASLQHANLSTPEPPANKFAPFWSVSDEYNTNMASPAYPIGNSIAPLHIPLDSLERHTWPESTIEYTFYDSSYLLNDYLWDRYFFSAYNLQDDQLANPRLEVFDNAQRSKLADFDDSSSNLMVKGAFNVNSTSVAAWRALLGGLTGSSVERANGSDELQTDLSPFIRNIYPLQGDANGIDKQGAEVYSGFRSLDDDEVASLAAAIVEQVKKRGPFISMSHFVNRVVLNGNYRSDREEANLTGRETAVGALQAALENSTVNEELHNDNDLLLTEDDLKDRVDIYNLQSAQGSRGFGQPGYVTQADLLSRIGSVLSPRSDTFIIRAYGEAIDPITSRPESKAWCEMKVQRIPEEAAVNTNERRFIIQSFRWLNENDV